MDRGPGEGLSGAAPSGIRTLRWPGLLLFWALILGPAGTALAGREAPVLRSDQFLIGEARTDFAEQHDALAENALRKLLNTHPTSIFRGEARLLQARIAARKSVQEGPRDFRPVLDLFRRAEEGPPPGWDRGEVRYRMGRYLIRLRFYEEGRGYLEQVAQNVPDSPWVFRSRVAMADSFRQEGEPGQAEATFNALLPVRNGPTLSLADRLSYDYALGHLLMDSGHIKKAGSRFIGALALSSATPYRHPDILFLLGRYAYLLRHSRRSARLFRTFERLYPADPRASQAQYYLARISGRMGHPARERARLRELVEDNPGTTGSSEARIRLLRMTLFPGQKAGAALPEVRKKALSQLDAIERDEPVRRVADQARLLEIRILASSGKWEAALRRSTLLLEGNDPKSPFGRALLKEEQTILMARLAGMSHPLRPDPVLEIVRSYKAHLPGPSESGGGVLALLMARVYHARGEKVRANRFLDRAIASPTDLSAATRARTLRFDWLLAESGPGPARAFAERMLADPDVSGQDRSPWFSRATDLAEKQGDATGERQLLINWLRSGTPPGENPRVRARLGLLDLSAGRDGQGERELASALPGIARNPGQKPLLAQALYHLGEAAWSHGDQTGAAGYWGRFLACCPEDSRKPWVMYEMGNMALERGDRAGALAWFRKSEKNAGGQEIGRVARLKIESLGLEKSGEKP